MFWKVSLTVFIRRSDAFHVGRISCGVIAYRSSDRVFVLHSNDTYVSTRGCCIRARLSIASSAENSPVQVDQRDGQAYRGQEEPGELPESICHRICVASENIRQ